MIATAKNNEATWWIYVVRCVDGTLYTGVARDCEARIDAHNAGLGAKYTRNRRPVTLVYAEAADSRSAAQQREWAIKRLNRRQKLALIGRTAAGQPA